MAQNEEIKQDEKHNDWDKLPNNPAKYFPQPVYWVDPKGKEHIFVCADYDDPTLKSKIQSYCINNSTWTTSTDYPKNSKPYRFTVSIDQNNGLLYIYGGTFAVFLQYDLKQNKWITICKNGQYEEQNIATKHNIKQTGWYPKSLFIPKINTFNVISGLANKHHLIWDETSKKMKTVSEFKSVSFGHNVLWMASQSKVLMMGGIHGYASHSNAVLSCDITSAKQKIFTWKNCDFQLPLGICYFGSVCYGNIIILFGGEKEGSAEIDDIWWLDTMKVNDGWVKSNIKCPRIGRFYAIKTNNNMVHLFQMGANNHWVININKIVEKEGMDEIKNNSDEYLQQKVKVLENKLLNLNEMYKVLQDDHKILQEQYERQGKELKKFREQYGFDESNYLTWNSDKIVDWLISLEWPRYCKYEFNLRNNLKKENVDGEILGYVNRTDWTRFGINDIKDKIDLEKHLAKLIPNYGGAAKKKNNNDNEVDIEQEEGQQTVL